MTVTRQISILGLFCGMLMSVTGCQTASLEDAAPTGARATSSSDAPKANPSVLTRNGLPTLLPGERPNPEASDFVKAGVRNTGEFPHFKPLESANHQLTAAEINTATAEMAKESRAQGGSDTSKMSYAERLAYLRKVAATHADEAEAQIAK